MTTGLFSHAPLADKLAPKAGSRFVSRQPILTGDERVFGYELLFRGGVESYFATTNSTTAARSILDSSLLIGFDILCDGRRAFINCTRDILVKDYVTLLPPAQNGGRGFGGSPA